MQLTTKIEYAIRALSELAVVNDSRPVTIKEICKRQNLPVKYLEQLFRKLKQKGLIKSIKGANGGYLLNTSPEQLSIRNIMAAVEDDFVGLNCSGKEGHRDFCIGQPCHFYTVWQDIKSDFDDYLDNIPLTRFIESQASMKSKQGEHK